MNDEVSNYNLSQPTDKQSICDELAKIINNNLKFTENKIWHGHPVWFISGNPIVGYSVQKPGVRLMFWSGQSFDEPDLNVRGEKFKDASIFYNSGSEINSDDIKRWLKKSELLQWDYKNIVKNKGIVKKLY